MTRRDEFDDQDSFIDSVLQRSRSSELPSSFKKTAIVLGVAAAVGVLGGVMYTTYFNGGNSSSEVPIIQAETRPYKIEPENPGGMNVANKESTVFDTLRGENQNRIENLLDDAEKPVEKEDYFAERDQAIEKAQNAAIASPSDVAADDSEKTDAIAEVIEEDAAEQPLDTPLQTADAAKTVTEKMNTTPKSLVAVDVPESATAESAPTETPAESTPATPTPVETKPEAAEVTPSQTAAAKVAAEEPAAADPKADVVSPTAGGTYYVQLASVKSESDARGQWPKLQTKNPELAALSLRVQPADLGAKGTFYRIQAGPLTEAQAKKVCGDINARQAGGCIVSKP